MNDKNEQEYITCVSNYANFCLKMNSSFNTYFHVRNEILVLFWCSIIIGKYLMFCVFL